MCIYEKLDDFEKALQYFRTKIECTCAMEMGGKLTSEDAYKIIKNELKDLKKFRKKFRKKVRKNIYKKI